MATKQGASRLNGPILVGVITSVCSAGFLLFGYDQGVMSGVVISSIWKSQMGNPSTLMIGTITALYDVGAVVGAIAAAFTAEPMGRKRTLIFGSVILLLGAVLMSASYERVQFMVARVVTGIGIGYITSVTPVYQSEISSAAQRGWQVCCQLTTMLVGLMLAYWINYGFFFYNSSVQWRFPLAFQCVFAVYIVVVTAFLPDTPRWLMRHDESPERGLRVLASLRGKAIDHPEVQNEKNQILTALSVEIEEGGAWSDLFRSNGTQAHKRFYLALGVQFMQQMTGINIVTYYVTILFMSSLGMSQESSLFLGCFVQLWYVLASFITWYTIDRVGRRKLLISMAFAMCCVLVAEAVCVASGTKSGAIGAVVFVFLFEAAFTAGWMATVWIYPAEVLPLKTRAKGASLAAAANFLGNFLVVEVTPIGLQNIGWKFYLVWAVTNLINGVIVYCLYPETATLQLEAIDKLFAEESVDHEAVEISSLRSLLQWSVVPRSTDAVKRRKRLMAIGIVDSEAGTSSGRSGLSLPTDHKDLGTIQVDFAK